MTITLDKDAVEAIKSAFWFIHQDHLNSMCEMRKNQAYDVADIYLGVCNRDNRIIKACEKALKEEE